MIINAEKIYINGSVMPVYSIDFSNNGGKEPSVLEIKLVNQTGDYKHPTKQTSSPTVIKIGNFFTFKGYPVSSTISNSSEGNILSIKYMDTSIILDKIFVGLKGIHGAGFDTVYEGTSQNVILLGEQVDPCAGIQSNFDDPCNPFQSSSMAEQVPGDIVSQEGLEKRIDCEQQKKIQILDVVYKFQDLLTAARAKNIVFSNLPRFIENNTYYNRTTGSLREVLNQWCADYNITFVWDNGVVRFVDLKNGIDINDSGITNGCQMRDYSETETIEDNSTYGAITYFGAQGEIKQYDSNQSNNVYRLSLIPLTLRDILGTTNVAGTSSEIYWSSLGYEGIEKSPILKNELEKLEFFLAMLALENTSVLARDLFILRYLYDFFTDLKDNPDSKCKEYKELGIVLEKYIESDNSDLVKILESSPDMSQKALSKKGLKIEDFVFFRGYKKLYLKDRYLKFEERLINDFVGKYWIRTINSANVQYSAPDGSVKSYQSSAKETNTGFVLDIGNIIPATKWNSIVNNFLFTTTDTEDNPETPEDERTTKNVADEKSAIVLERTGSWAKSPVGDIMDVFEEVLEKIRAPYLEFDSNAEVLTEEDQDKEDKSGVKYMYFAFKVPTANELRAIELDDGIKIIDHPFENKNITVSQNEYTTTYGLRSTKCKSFTVAKGKIRFYTPVQCWDYGSEFAGYTIIRTGTSSGNTINVGLEKQQFVLTKIPAFDNLSLSLSINYRDVTQQFVSLLEKGTIKKCQYNVESIRELVKDFSRQVFDPPFNPKNKVLLRKDYSLSGFPAKTFTVSDGLQSISIRFDGNDGWSTQLSFSSIPKIRKSENILNKDFEINWIRSNGNKIFRSGLKNIL
jgi:hypothetical protein